jgi:HEAT repeat protein
MIDTSLVRALDSTDAEERRQATARIVDLAAGDAIPLLLRSLGDADWRVRKQATLSARAFAGQLPLLEALVARLGPSTEQGIGDVGLRNAIVDVLGAAGQQAVDVVGARLSELDADGRKLAVEVLGRSGDPSALAPLRTCLADIDDNVRHAAVESVALLGGVARDEVIEVLQRCLEDEDRFVRLTALGGLQTLDAPLSWERLEPLALDPTTRAAALAAAGSTESPRAARALARALSSARGGALAQALAAMTRMLDGQHRGDAARALRAEGPALAERLLGLAGVPAPVSEPRSVASQGFGEGAGESMDQRAMALILAAAAAAPGAAEAAIEALGEQAMAGAAPRALSLLGGAALPAVLARLQSGSRGGHADPLAAEADARATLLDVAAAIARAPGAQASEVREVLGALRRAAVDPERGVATSALFQLSHLGTAEDLAPCAELTLARDPAVAHAAEGALKALAARHPAPARALANASAAEDSSSLTAILIISALAGDGAPVLADGNDLPWLASAAVSVDPRTRRAAVEAVAVADPRPGGGVSAFDVLTVALADEERSVQIAAARALGRFGARAPTSPAPRAPAPGDAEDPRGRLQKPRASDVLELVGRSHDEDLLAATVRALGDVAAVSARLLAPLSPRIGWRESAAPVRADSMELEDADELVAALAPLARSAPSVVAFAAVEALARASSSDAGRLEALCGGLDHADPSVVEATLLKMATLSPADEVEQRIVERALARCLRHSSPDIRALCAQTMASVSASQPPDSGRDRGRG